MKDGISPAAFSALARGDMGNAMAAMLLGGIEQQEKDGQSALARTQNLPIEGMERCRNTLEKAGFVIGEPADQLFYQCVFPVGWNLKPTDHSMWSDLIDDKGRKRAAVFYKAAFYDQQAFIRLERRYWVDGYVQCGESQLAVAVMDGASILRSFGAYDKDNGWDRKESLVESATKWLEQNYPQWNDVTAYWD